MAKQNEIKCNGCQGGCKCSPKEALTVSAKELAIMLGVSVRQIWRLNAAGMLPRAVSLGGSRKWLRKEIEAFLEAGCPDRETWEMMKGGAA